MTRPKMQNTPVNVWPGHKPYCTLGVRELGAGVRRGRAGRGGVWPLAESVAQVLLQPQSQRLREERTGLGVHLKQHLLLDEQEGQAQAQQLVQEGIVLTVGPEVLAYRLGFAMHPAGQPAGGGTHGPGHTHRPGQSLP